MKKVLSVFLCFIICVSSIVSYADTSDGISVELTGLTEFAAGEYVTLSCRIKGAPEGTLARLELYIDGEYFPEATKDISLKADMNESVSFYMPHNFDRAYLHTAMVILKYGDTEKHAHHIFSLGAYPEITMSFCSTPLAITPNHELYYGVEFATPVGKSYKVQARGIARSLAVEDFKEIIVTNGHREIIRVDGKYVGDNVDYFDFAYEIYGNWYGEKIRILKEHKKEVPAPVSPAVTPFATPSQAINPVIIPATVNYTTSCYSTASLSGYVGSVNKGTVVEYLNPNNHNSMSAAKVKLPSGTICWVPMSAVTISSKNFTIPDKLTNEEKEAFVNSMGYESDTSYLIWVSKERQKLFVFMGSKGNWKICNSFPVATGKNATPTPTTVCKYEYKTRWVTSSYICDPVLSLFGAYAIHNQPVSHSGYVLDRTMGNPASAGCIRMLYNDVNWLWYYIPVKTTVVIY